MKAEEAKAIAIKNESTQLERLYNMITIEANRGSRELLVLKSTICAVNIEALRKHGYGIDSENVERITISW